MRIRTPKRIRLEDFPAEDRESMGIIAGSLNDFYDDVIFLLNKRIQYDNINRQLVSVNINTDSSGNITTPAFIRSSLTSRPVGIVPLSVLNRNGTTVSLAYTPFIQFTFDGTNVIINEIQNLGINQQLTLTLEIVGS